MCKQKDCKIDYPEDKQKCCCGGIIRFLYCKDHEQHYECESCGAYWCWD